MANIDRIQKTFFDLVQIESPSFNEKRITSYLKGYLEKLNFEVTIDSAGKKIGGNSGNLIGFYNGENKKAPTLIFAAHMDTVTPCLKTRPLIENKVVRSNGSTVLGADDKAGISAILEMLEIILKNKIYCGDIEVIFTVAEEKGLLGAKNLDLSKIKAKYAYVVDCEGPIGKIVNKAPSQDWIKAHFKGKAVHAGLYPEKGINAIIAASKAISEMKLGRIDEETTANVGVIKGGTATNIVPDSVKIEGEARSLSEEKLKNQINHMIDNLNSAAKSVGADVEIEVIRAYDSFSLDINDEVVKIALKAAEVIDFDLKFESTGGGSDTNIFNQNGIPALNLSVGMNNVHSKEENISLDDIGKTAEFLVEIVKVAGLRGT
ncbi:MAG: M20/M25/M40 family metallo-hydrolase [Actinobacteria bacterium]|nr:M20/M25/M40 family metallo-hydrolase [Actinomycetota bacterium]